jgi:hypothetical protein
VKRRPQSSQRQVNITPEIVASLPEAQLEQLRVMAEDDDNRCCMCDGIVSDASVEVVMFTIGSLKYVRYSHSACRPSGIYRDPQSIARWEQTETNPGDREARARGGTNMTTMLAMRGIHPRALVFIELTSSVSTPDEPDPYARYAELLGLSPITEDLTECTPRPAGKDSYLRTANGRLMLVHELGEDEIIPPPDELDGWLDVARADGNAFLITGFGMRLGTSIDVIKTALAERPAWGAIVPVRRRARGFRRRA